MLSLTCQGISALGLFYIDIILKTLRVQELITHTPPEGKNIAFLSHLSETKN